MTTSRVTRQYWMNIIKAWAEERLSPPQLAELTTVLDELMSESRPEAPAEVTPKTDTLFSAERVKRATEAVFKLPDKQLDQIVNYVETANKTIEIADSYIKILSAAICIIQGKRPDLFTGEVEAAALEIARRARQNV